MNGGPRWASQPPLPGQQATVRRKAAAPSCHSLLLLLLLLLHIYLPTLSLHFFKLFLLFRELYRPRTLYPVRFSEVAQEDGEGWSGRPWQGRGGGVAGRRGRAGFGGRTGCCSHPGQARPAEPRTCGLSLSQSTRMAGRANPASESRIGSGGS